MRRIITETVDGRSRARIADVVPDSPLALLWDTSPERPLGYPPAAVADGNPKVPPGHSSWRVAAVPPHDAMREYLAAGIAGMDEGGFHASPTVNYVMLLDGAMTLALDDGEFDLHPGDVVVQRATRHAWYNHSDRPLHLLVLMIGLPEGALDR